MARWRGIEASGLARRVRARSSTRLTGIARSLAPRSRQSPDDGTVSPVVRRLQIAVIAASVLIGAGILANHLSARAVRFAGHNDVRATATVIRIQPAATMCQNQEALPRSTRTVVLASAPTRPSRIRALLVVKDNVGRRLLESRSVSRAAASVEFATPAVTHSVALASVCLTNEGTRALSLTGQPTGPGRVLLNGRSVGGIVRIDYLRRGYETWFGLLPTVAHRVAIMKPQWVGAWTFWCLVAGVVASYIATATVLVRNAPRHRFRAEE
jgi:hypothetical protein